MSISSPGGLSSPFASMLASANFARAYTQVCLTSVFGSFAIIRVGGLVTYVTIVAGLCVLGVSALIARREEFSRLRLLPFTVLLFLGWTLLSVFWSADRSVSFVSWLCTAGIAVLAITIGHIRDTLQTLRATGNALRVLLTVSLIMEMLSGILIDMPLPFLGIRGNLAELQPIQGIFGTRNVLGLVAVIAVITFWIELLAQAVTVRTAIVSIVLAGLLGVLTWSPTVALLGIVLLVVSGILALVRRAPANVRSSVQWSLGAAALTILLVGYVIRDQLVDLLGARRDLFNRLTLWDAIGDFVRFDPVRGQGWYGPWRLNEWPFSAITSRLGRDHHSGLNAFMDVLLQVGWVGLSLFLALIGVALVRSWIDASERRSIVHAWVPLILVTLVVDSIFESFTLSGFGWMLLVICVVRAGQSRSWRALLNPAGTEIDLPPRAT